MKLEAPDGTYDMDGDPPLAVDFMFDFLGDTPEIKKKVKDITKENEHILNTLTSELQYRSKFRSIDKDFHQTLAAKIACSIME